MTRKNIHFIGIGGVGMAGLAVLLKARGHEVSGCDLHASPRTAWLEGMGVRVRIGHDPAHLAGVDEVVVTPAVNRDNPELAAFRGSVRYRGEVLADVVSGAADTIAVCGSHGKTTTATWIAKLLKALGENVSWCIGGETGSFPVAGAAGKSKSEVEVEQRMCPVLVVEADESDGTLALYRAKTLVVNRCDYDHPDHFKTEADYFACYEAAKRQAGDVIESEKLGALKGLENLDALDALAPHNRKNARAAVEVALRRGHSLESIAKALPAVVAELPDRRFQKIADGVYIDYGHHPTEMKCAVEMARACCRGKLRVLFQPHRYSRTKALLAQFPAAFDGADEVVLCPTYAAFEPPVEGGDIADLYAVCRASGMRGLFLARSCEEAWTHAKRSTRPGDLTLVLGAGDIVGKLRELSPERIWIGAGANTWKPDLNLGVEYVKTSGPAGVPGASLGIPWMAGIPGTVGGWIKMNAGAFGHSISEALEAVKVDGEWIPASACGFAYRHSDIAGEIQDFRLKDEYSPARLASSAPSASDYLAKRRRFPAGTCGSFFKNPAGDSAGRLLEQAGAKDLRVGGAFVWSEHANVIVRSEGATPSDVLALARLMRNRVLFRFGIALEPEVCGITF